MVVSHMLFPPLPKLPLLGHHKRKGTGKWEGVLSCLLGTRDPFACLQCHISPSNDMIVLRAAPWAVAGEPSYLW